MSFVRKIRRVPATGFRNVCLHRSRLSWLLDGLVSCSIGLQNQNFGRRFRSFWVPKCIKIDTKWALNTLRTSKTLRKDTSIPFCAKIDRNLLWNFDFVNLCPVLRTHLSSQFCIWKSAVLFATEFLGMSSWILGDGGPGRRGVQEPLPGCIKDRRFKNHFFQDFKDDFRRFRALKCIRNVPNELQNRF